VHLSAPLFDEIELVTLAAEPRIAELGQGPHGVVIGPAGLCAGRPLGEMAHLAIDPLAFGVTAMGRESAPVSLEGRVTVKTESLGVTGEAVLEDGVVPRGAVHGILPLTVLVGVTIPAGGGLPTELGVPGTVELHRGHPP